jgi:hypothetical protein
MTRSSATGESRTVSRMLIPSAKMCGLGVNAGEAIPVRVIAVYVRCDRGSSAGSSSSGGSTLSMPTKLVPLSILLCWLLVDDGLCSLASTYQPRTAIESPSGFQKVLQSNKLTVDIARLCSWTTSLAVVELRA